MDYEDRLRALVLSNDWFMAALRVARELELPDWGVTAGAIRNIVWDRVHGFEQSTPVNDMDVDFFDPTNTSRERDKGIEQELSSRFPGVPWEVTNQAGVHLWYESRFGHPISPITSLEDGISRAPETATAIGVRLETDDSVTIIAPCGLDDVFALILRRNPKQVTREYFHQRLREKRITERWPKVSVIDD